MLKSNVYLDPMNGTETLVNQQYGKWRAGIGLVTVAGLLLVGCAPQDAVDDDELGSPEPEQTDSVEESPDAEDEDELDDSEDDIEAAIEAEDGFWRLNTLPEPVAEVVMEAGSEEAGDQLASAKLEVLSLDSDGDYARLVAAWLPPEEGPRLSSAALVSDRDVSRVGSGLSPLVRLVDREAEEVVWPLHPGGSHGQVFDPVDPPQVSDEEDIFQATAPDRWRDTCVCSLVNMEDPAATGEPEETVLFYVDFPLPESGTVDILAGQWHQPIPEVDISEDEPFTDDHPELTMVEMPPEASPDEIEELPQVYGTGAGYQARVPLQARSRGLTGVTTTEHGDSREVSLPSDVLFDFGEHALTSEATAVIEDAAEMLNEEALDQEIVIEGHTDNVDGHDINQPLSENRAEAVAEAIDPLLDDSISYTTEGHSFDQPLVPNETVEGDPIEENQALNRRVSFRYTQVEESQVSIELGEFDELDELPDAEETEPSEDALAAFHLAPPEEATNQTEVQLDLYGADRHGDQVAFEFGISELDLQGYNPDAFSGWISHEEPHTFQPAWFQRYAWEVPHLSNISLVDVEGEQEFFPVEMSDKGCLCSESNASFQGLSGQPAHMFAEFQLPENIEGPLLLRVPDAGQIEIPEEILNQIQDTNN